MASAVDVAVLGLTAGGSQLALGMGVKLNAKVYLPSRLKDIDINNCDVYWFDDFSQCVERVFRSHRKLIFIMAAGIVVRKLAPLISDKNSDPAVVVMDETGQFAISLLGGHRAGANELAHILSKATGAMPVITTATDVRGKTAVDVLADKLKCGIYPLHRVKYFNRLLAENYPVYLYNQWLQQDIPGFISCNWQQVNQAGEHPTVLISNRLVSMNGANHIKLRPRNLVVGVGCRRGVTTEEIIQAIKGVFREYKLSIFSLACLASLDIKQDEQGLIDAASYFRVPLEFVSNDDINKLTGYYQESETVKQKIGVGGVCEPSALHVSQGKLLVTKQRWPRVTVAVAEQPLQW